MSMQIITNFDTEAKFCYAADKKHGECLIEGRASENVKGLGRIASEIILDIAQQSFDAKDTHLIKKPHPELDLYEQLVIAAKNLVEESISKELAKKIVKRKLRDEVHVPEGLEGAIAEVIVEQGWDLVGNQEEGEKE